MNDAIIKEQAKQMLADYLSSKGINIQKSFRCLNPEHIDSNPSMYFDPARNKCHCFSCHVDYDIFDVVQLEYNLIDYSEIFQKTYDLLGLKGNDQNKYIPITHNNRIVSLENKAILDFNSIVQQAHQELLENEEALSYLQVRGLSMKLIMAYQLGYHQSGYNHFLKDFPEYQTKSDKAIFYRYIFPYWDLENKCSYFLTEIEDRQKIDDYNGKYRKPNHLHGQLFNERYIQQCESLIIFVCEGIYDALSVEEVGGKAMALVGTAHRRFLALCKEYRPNCTFVLLLDNDSAGQQAIQRMEEGLISLHIQYEIRHILDGKDVNEALQNNREALQAYIQGIIAEIERGDCMDENPTEIYLKKATAYQLQTFIQKKQSINGLSTGFASLDVLLNGGLFAGLYVLGAISSLGKTTFGLQLLDQIASQGHDVLFFSLEMAQNELIAKSISRHSFLINQDAKTTRDVLVGNYDERSMKKAINAYSKYAHHVFIQEGDDRIGIAQIRASIEHHRTMTGRAPVVLLDYLQIVAPSYQRYTDKQNVDQVVLALKRMSRDFSIPIFCISSFNRENYMAPVSMMSFKESGAVEYSSDVLLALQYEGMDWVQGESEKNRMVRIRNLMQNVSALGKQGKAQTIQLKVLKNRNGSNGDICLDFFPMFNCFCERQDNIKIEKWTKSSLNGMD